MRVQARILLALWLALLSLAPAAPAVHADDYADCKGVNSLGVGTLSPAPLDTVALTWTLCAGAAGDWVGLYAAGASDSALLAYWFTDGHAASSTTAVIPSATTPGPYEFRIFSGKTTNRLAQSPGIYVQGTATVTGSLSHVWSSLARGSQQALNWTVSTPHAGDHFVIYLYGGAAAQTCNTDAHAAGQIECPIDPAQFSAGTYVACLYSGLTAAQLACDSTFTVT